MTIENCHEEENVDDVDEELSLCDLPITLINITTQDQLKKEDSLGDNETQEEFYFLISKEQEMCDADDVFFQGQILPLSSKACLLAKYNDDDKGNHQLNHSDSIRFKSLDLSLSEIQSNSSRSSSFTSHNLSRSTSSTTTTTSPRISISNSKTINQFHTHPSPKPQLKKSPPNKKSSRKSSSTRKYLRIGVMPTPEMRLKDLKVRSATTTTIKPFLTSADKNCDDHNSNNSRKSVKKSNKSSHHVDNNKDHCFKKFVHKGGGLLRSGCKCSVETVCSSIVKIKGGTKSASITETTQHAMKEEVVELKNQKHEEK